MQALLNRSFGNHYKIIDLSIIHMVDEVKSKDIGPGQG